MTQTTQTRDDTLIRKVAIYVESYMSNYDASHDWQHILRVVGLAKRIAATSPTSLYNLQVVTLAALLHDVGDRKYLLPGQDATTLVENVLVSLGANSELARAVQTIASNVSYSSEVKNPQKVLDVIEQYPELAVVQDADRLDAIGAIGIGRCFTFGGAMFGKEQALAAAGIIIGDAEAKSKNGGDKGRGLAETMVHFDEKLVKLEGMMKTEAGREMARERTSRLGQFMAWWDEEAAASKDGEAALS